MVLFTVTTWSFLTNHGRTLVCIARDPGARLRDIATALDITERRTQGILSDLIEAGYVVKTKQGRRNHYHIRSPLPLPESTVQEHSIGEVLDILADQNGRRKSRRRSGEDRRAGTESRADGERRAEAGRRATDTR